MKTKLTILITIFAFTTCGAFADQPAARLLYSPKGNILAIVRDTPAMAAPIATATAASTTKPTCKSMLVFSNLQKVPPHAVSCGSAAMQATADCKRACAMR